MTAIQYISLIIIALVFVVIIHDKVYVPIANRYFKWKRKRNLQRSAHKLSKSNNPEIKQIAEQLKQYNDNE